MAKKKNIVVRTRRLAGGILIGGMAVGWALAASVLLLQNDARKQEAMIRTAQVYLEDKLYIRAVAQYQEALSAFKTKNNPRYETELLSLYREAGMTEEYFQLMDSRIEAKTAQPEEYRIRAEALVREGLEREAFPVLQQGINLYGTEELTQLYEEISYQYSMTETNVSQALAPPSDWYIPAFDGEKWGYLNVKGKTALEFLYEEAIGFSGNYAVVKLDGVYTLIDKNGYWNAVDKNDLNRVTALCGKRLAGEKDGRYRIYTNTFQPVEEASYEDVCLSDNGLAAVKENGAWTILDPSLEAVTDQKFADIVPNSRGQLFAKGYAVVADEKGYFLINEKGEACFEERFARAKGIEGGLVAVDDGSGKWGFINEKAEMIVPCQYEDASSFSDRLAAVQYAGEWGYINRYNTMVIEPQFAEAQPFLAGRSLVRDTAGSYQILTLDYYDLF